MVSERTVESTAELAIRELVNRVKGDIGATQSILVAALLAQARRLHRAAEDAHIGPRLELAFSRSVARVDEIEGTRFGHLDLIFSHNHDRSDPTQIVISPKGEAILPHAEIDFHADIDFAVYVIEPWTAEYVQVGSSRFDLYPIEGVISPLALPYFRDLGDALADYADQRAKYSTCPYLADAWLDDRRIIFANKPEKFMRRSLQHYLEVRLRDSNPSVFSEQNVNETEPVDVRVQWLDGRRMSIIEIKWLGASVSADGGHISTEYSLPRARAGFRQATHYLSEQRQTAPSLIVRSELVVFDGRRGDISGTPANAVSGNPLRYELEPLAFDGADEADSGIRQPLRLFMYPVT